jgi:hypothetical protein
MSSIFEVLIFIGRPAAGKSEILAHLESIQLSKRRDKYRIGELDVIDDFPMLWTWFEEDEILSNKLGRPRLHSVEGNYFIFDYLWDLLIERISLEYDKRLRDNGVYHRDVTTIIEFSRGSEHGGYARAFEHLSQTILAKAGIVYVQVSFAESLRKNRRRFNPQRPDSLLEHGLEDEKMNRLYAEDDWQTIRAGGDEYLNLQQGQVPYVIFENEDDVTTAGGALLEQRLEETLNRLWRLVK